MDNFNVGRYLKSINASAAINEAKKRAVNENNEQTNSTVTDNGTDMQFNNSTEAQNTHHKAWKT